MISAIRRWASSKWSLVVGLLLMAVAGGLFALSLVQVNDEAKHRKEYTACLGAWADKSAARTTRLAGLSTARNDALDKFLRSLASRDEAKERAAYNAYLSASDAYNTAVKANPPPAPPRLAC